MLAAAARVWKARRRGEGRAGLAQLAAAASPGQARRRPARGSPLSRQGRGPGPEGGAELAAGGVWMAELYASLPYSCYAIETRA
jgi:hypothetical protein